MCASMPNHFTCNLWTVACQAPLSMGFSRQEYWSGLPFPPSGDLPDPGIKPGYPALAGRLFTTGPPGKPPNSVQFSCSVMYDSWRSPGLQHARPPCPSLRELKLMSIESVMPSNHLILCSTLLFPPSIFPSIRVFSNESALCIRWPKYWSFSFNISPSNEYSGLISFRIDWFDLAIQGTLEHLLQHHSSKASILWCSAFFMVQLLHPYMTT